MALSFSSGSLFLVLDEAKTDRFKRHYQLDRDKLRASIYLDDIRDIFVFCIFFQVLFSLVHFAHLVVQKDYNM